MTLVPEIQAAKDDPARLEGLYQSAQRDGRPEEFRSALLACYGEDPDNVLLAAWFYRLQGAADAGTAVRGRRRTVNWALAIPLSIVTGLIFWALSDFENLLYQDHLPALVFWWSPIATMTALVFLAVTAKKNRGRALALGLGLLAAAAYAVLLAPTLQTTWKINQYLDLAAIHLPLLCWIALGISVLGFKASVADRFAFLIKSVEVMITAGLYLIAGVVLGGITVGMFDALSISLPDIMIRLIAAGGFGLLPVMAVASVYDPAVPPSEQEFDQGLSKFIATMMHLLLPLALGVLVVYVLVIPFYFMQPFENRDVLIVYNLMLFAIMGLLVGATPIADDELSPRLGRWLRTGIIVVAILAAAVSLYALSATVYRTFAGGLTINRLTIIGWNIVNIGILVGLLVRQQRDARERWVASLKSVFGVAPTAYLLWVLFLLLVVPLLF